MQSLTKRLASLRPANGIRNRSFHRWIREYPRTPLVAPGHPVPPHWSVPRRDLGARPRRLEDTRREWPRGIRSRSRRRARQRLLFARCARQTVFPRAEYRAHVLRAGRTRDRVPLVRLAVRSTHPRRQGVRVGDRSPGDRFRLTVLWRDTV